MKKLVLMSALLMLIHLLTYAQEAKVKSLEAGKKEIDNAVLRVPEMFSDNMVLQREKPIVIWGWATPNASVSVQLDTETKTAIAAENGTWLITLSPKPAGGPFELTVTQQAEKEIFHNVMLGDVWLLSGQSNMGWSVLQSKDGEKELNNADYPNIRLLSIMRAMGNRPLEQTDSTAWQTCTRSSVANFSAVGSFFGRALHNELKVPIGLIQSSWGGTNIEAWMSREALHTIPKFNAILDSLPLLDLKTMTNTSLTNKKQWLDEMERDDIGKKEQWHTLNDVSDWKNITLPGLWEDALLKEIDGVIWISKTVDLTEAEVREKIEISLGRIDNEDVAYVNGIEVGASVNKDLTRNYAVPPGVFKKGTNRITVRTKDTGSIGGFRSAPDKLYLKTKTLTHPLAGTWSYALGTPDLKRIPKEVHPNNYPSVLFNAMIHPLLKYRVKGVLWYQGESNASRADEYSTLFPELINDWRKRIGEDVSFLFVQLPNYKEVKNIPGKSEWAELREAQRDALQLPNTGMAVTIDIGEADDIHPKNKQEVARRLVLLAKKQSYGEQRVAEAPHIERMEKIGSKMHLYFANEGSALKTTDGSASLKGFAIAGPDQNFEWAEASLDPKNRNAVIVSHPKIINPVAVRYAWADNPGVLNLVSTEGLPAEPFRTDRPDSKEEKLKGN